MFLIADLLERAKAGAGIDSDYRLAKIIGITHGAMSHYRMGRTLPNEKVIEQLCALSGDDPDLIAAQIQAARAPNEAAKNLWLRIAARLGGGVSTAILSVLFAIGLVALPADPAQAESVQSFKSAVSNSIYIVSSTILSGHTFLLVRLRCRWPQLAGCCRAIGLCGW